MPGKLSLTIMTVSAFLMSVAFALYIAPETLSGRVALMLVVFLALMLVMLVVYKYTRAAKAGTNVPPSPPDLS